MGNLLMAFQAFTNTLLKVLPASVHGPTPKPFPHFRRWSQSTPFPGTKICSTCPLLYYLEMQWLKTQFPWVRNLGLKLNCSDSESPMSLPSGCVVDCMCVFASDLYVETPTPNRVVLGGGALRGIKYR